MGVLFLAREKVLQLGVVHERVVLAGEHERPVGVGLLGDGAQALQEHLQVGPAAPLDVDPVLDRVPAGLLHALARELRAALVVADVDLGAGLLAEDPDEPQDLVGLAVRGDQVGSLQEPSAGLEPATPSLPWKCSTN